MALPAKEYTKRQISLNRRSMVNSVKWGWFRDIGWHPHLYQIAAHNSAARYRTTCAGRRGGKSEWAGREASAYMIAGPFRVWIVAPSYELGEREFRVVWDSLHHPANPYQILTQHNNVQAGQLDITLENGSECRVISIDKPRKSAHGEEVDLIILSECGISDRMGGETGVWNKTLVGAMSTRRADVVIPTTPQGQEDFLYPMFMKGLDPDHKLSSKYRLYGGKVIDLREYYKCKEEFDPDYFSLQWPAWVNIEGFNEDVGKLLRELPYRIFMEQVAGFFVKWSGSIWLNDFCYDPNIHLIDAHHVPHWWRRIEIIDPGYSGLFAWIAAVIDGEGNIIVVDEYSTQRTLFKDHYNAIIQKRREFASINGHIYNNDAFIPVYVDPEDPQCRAELSQLGLHCTPANNDTVAGFQSGALMFKTGRLHIFRTCLDVDRGLRNHEWAKQSQEGMKAKEAQDVWKHWSDLFRYLSLAAIWPAEKPEAVVPDDGIYRESVDELLKMVGGKDLGYMDMDTDQWEKLHNAA